MKKFYLASVLTFLGLFSGQFAYAICPLCVVAIGAGLGLSRWLGVDDLVSSVWIGGLLVALIGWTIDWFNRKNIHFMFRNAVTALAYYLLVLLPLYYGHIIGHPLNKFWGVDKIILGTIIGTIITILAIVLHFWMKKNNGGKVYFPYQKVVIPVASLIITSLIIYFLIK